MSVLDSLDDLVTETSVTVQRTTNSTFVSGRRVAGTVTTFPIDIVLQPAFNLNRVIGGANLDATVEGQTTTNVRQLHTRTLLYTRNTSPTQDPDVIINLKGANWTVARVEEWEFDDEVHYHCVISKDTHGAA